MTRPRVLRDLLMMEASFSRSPWDSDFFCRSLPAAHCRGAHQGTVVSWCLPTRCGTGSAPARSTRFKQDLRVCVSPCSTDLLSRLQAKTT